MPKSRDFGIDKWAGIQGFRDPGINSLPGPKLRREEPSKLKISGKETHDTGDS